ncbi:MAG: hypothetical protein RLZZ157_894 [Pseudomonadota bacterium]|jgi:DNA-nicking Smr family endonuclease
MARRRDLSPDELLLWGKVAKTVRPYQPLPEVARAAEPSPEIPASPAVVAKPKRAPLASGKPAPPVKAAPKPPVADVSGHKQVRRGKLSIDARIDLHGMRQHEAHAALIALVASTRAAHGRTILVVTGKGQRLDRHEDFMEPQRGVMRRRLPDWLNGHGLREHIAGFASAHPRDGGEGAYYVVLKSNRAPPLP